MKKVNAEPYRDIDFSHAERGAVIKRRPVKTKVLTRVAVFLGGLTAGILGFIAGIYVAAGAFGLHETVHVMAISFTVAVVSGLLGATGLRKLFANSNAGNKTVPILILACALAGWLLFKFVGY